jgi:hypothetical protein
MKEAINQISDILPPKQALLEIILKAQIFTERHCGVNYRLNY